MTLQQLIDGIIRNIKDNFNGSISGNLLQGWLLNIVDYFSTVPATSIKIGSITKTDLNAVGAASFLIKNTDVIKPAGYMITGGYFNITEAFVNNGGTIIQNYLIGVTTNDDNSILRKLQLISPSGGIFYGADGTGVGSRSNIDGDVIVNMQIYTDTNINTGTWSTGNVDYYITIQKI